MIKFKDREVTLSEGEFIVIPKGEVHMPVAEEEVHVMLIEPKSTLSTGILSMRRLWKIWTGYSGRRNEWACRT